MSEVQIVQLLAISNEARNLIYNTLSCIKVKDWAGYKKNFATIDELLQEGYSLKSSLLNLENSKPLQYSIHLVQGVEHFNTTLIIKDLIQDITNFFALELNKN